MRAGCRAMVVMLVCLTGAPLGAATPWSVQVDRLEEPGEGGPVVEVARKRTSKARRSTRARRAPTPQPELNGVLAGLATSCTLGACAGGAALVGAVMGTLPCLCVSVSSCSSFTPLGGCACGMVTGYGMVLPAVVALTAIPASALSGVVGWVATRGLSPPLWALLLGGMGGGLATFLAAALVVVPMVSGAFYFAYNAYRAQGASSLVRTNEAYVTQQATWSLALLGGALAAAAVILVGGITATGLFNGGLAWFLTPKGEEAAPADDDEEDTAEADDSEGEDAEEEEDRPRPRKKAKKPRKKPVDEDPVIPAPQPPPKDDVVPAQPTPKDEELIPRAPTPVLPEDSPPPPSDSPVY